MNRFTDNHPKLTALIINGVLLLCLINVLLHGAFTPAHIKAVGGFIEGPMVRLMEVLAQKHFV